MKKTVLLSKILVITSLFMGCNSSDNSDSEPVKNALTPESTATPTVTPTPKPTNNNDAFRLLNKARSVHRADTGIKFDNKKATNSASKMQRKSNNESETYNCGVSGTFTLTLKDNLTIIENSDCIYVEENKYIYENGVMAYANNNTTYFYTDYTFIPDYENYPGTGVYYKELGIGFSSENNLDAYYFNGTIDSYEQGNVVQKSHYYDFYYAEDIRTHYFYISGKTSDTFKCFSEDYTYETLEILIPHDSNPDYYKSGTIVINGMKYVYNGDKVTLSENGETATFLQQEVLEYFEEETSGDSCPNPNQLSKASSPKF